MSLQHIVRNPASANSKSNAAAPTSTSLLGFSSPQTRILTVPTPAQQILTALAFLSSWEARRIIVGLRVRSTSLTGVHLCRIMASIAAKHTWGVVTESRDWERRSTLCVDEIIQM